MNGKYPIFQLLVNLKKIRLTGTWPFLLTLQLLFTTFCLFLIHLIIKDSDIKRILFILYKLSTRRKNRRNSTSRKMNKLTDMDGSATGALCKGLPHAPSNQSGDTHGKLAETSRVPATQNEST